jgi:hypothetical protein
MNKLAALIPASLIASLASVHATPAGIDGLRLWLDPTDSATIQISGGLVTQWNDKSGQGNHATQPDPARQPVVAAGVLGGQNAIRLDAGGPGNFVGNPTDDGLLVNGAFSLNRAYTVFLVDQYWGANAMGRTLTSLDSNWLAGHWNGAEAHFTGNFIGPNVGVGLNAPLVSTAIGTGTSNYLFRQTRGSGYANDFLNQPGRLVIGDDTAGPWNEGSQSDIGDVIAFNRALTDTERWQVEDYLRGKYNQPFRLSHAHSTRTTVFSGGDTGEGLDLQGNFVAAVNVGGPGGFNIGNAAFTSDTGVTAENHIPGWQSSTFGGGAPTANDTNLRSVMDSIRWSQPGNGGPEDVSVTIPGLIPGNTYKVQLLFGEGGPNSTRHHAVEIEGKNMIRDFAEGSHRGTDNATGLGTAVVHEFVATDTSLDFRLHSTGLLGGDLNQLLNGFTVENRGVTGVTTTGTFTSASQLDFTGTFDYAVSMGGSGGQTVGSAAFTSETVGGVQIGAENTIAAWTPGVDFTGSADDAALGSAMTGIRWSETLGMHDGLSIDLTVIPGQEYKLQLMVMEGCCVGRGFDVSIEGVLTVRDFSADALGASGVNETGAVITHTLTATDDTLNIMLDGFATEFTDKNPILNAFTLERIPEPGSAALALFAAALLGRRRRC